MSPSGEPKITVRQFAILIFLGVIGDSILILPYLSAYYAKQDAWLALLCAFAAGMAQAGLIAAIANRMARRPLLDTAAGAFGRWGGDLFFALLLCYSFICSLTLLTEMNQFMTTQFIPETPVNAINIVFLAVLVIAYRYGVPVFARMSELLFTLFLALFAVLVILLLPQAHLANLKPIAASGFGPIFRSAWPAFSGIFAEMIVLLGLVPFVEGQGKLTKPIVKGFAFGGILLCVLILLSVLVLGPNLMRTKYYGAFVLAQKISIANFLERLEAVLTFLWIITVFYKSLFLFYALTNGTARLFRLKENKMLTIPIGMILIVCSIISTPNITTYNDLLGRYFHWFDFTFCVVLPGLLLVALLVRGKGKKAKAG